MDREKRILMAKDTVNCVNKGSYPFSRLKTIELTNPKVPKLIIDMAIKEKINQSKWFSVNENIVNEGVTDFIEDYNKENPTKSIIALNFASAKNPGGGFLNGALAQEECIASVSTLYNSLIQCNEFYEYHRKNINPLYSHRIIYSPDIQIFKSISNGKYLETPINCGIITSPAVNAKVAKSRGVSNNEIQAMMTERIYKIISVILENKPDCAVLGAFGCGVFGNDRTFVLNSFEKAINEIIPEHSIDIKFAIIK